MGGAVRRRMLSVARAEVAMWSTPRMEMALLLVVSGLAALLASYWLLRLGLSSMSVRYPLSAAAGYVTFIVVLRVWVWLRRADIETPDIDLDDAAELALSAPVQRFGSPAHADAFDAEGSRGGWDLDDLVYIAVLIAMAVRSSGRGLLGGARDRTHLEVVSADRGDLRGDGLGRTKCAPNQVTLGGVLDEITG